MLATTKFQRIARDLEKLPCELHGGILDDLEFSQLIRLSSCAGPRLTWSLEHSHSAWGDRFRVEDRSTWQTLLSSSDRVRHLCFAQPRTKEDIPYIFECSLAFLSFRNEEWKAITRGVSPGEVYNRSRFLKRKLARIWLAELTSTVVARTWPAFHEHYARLIAPWLPRLPPQATAVFSRVPELGNKDAVCHRYGYSLKDLPFSFNDLATFIEMYQQCRLLRAEELATELYRLAAIYEAHPTRLKEPFDPKVRAPEDLNTRHVPTDMRRRARKMIKKAKYARWKTGEGRIACFAWPALVPYESQVEMFQEHFSDAADIQIAPADIVDKCRAVIANAPSWARDTTEGEVDTVTHLSEALEQQHLSSHKLNPKVLIRAHKVELLRRAPAALPILPRGDAELEWLENFAVVAAWMEGRNTR